MPDTTTQKPKPTEPDNPDPQAEEFEEKQRKFPTSGGIKQTGLPFEHIPKKPLTTPESLPSSTVIVDRISLLDRIVNGVQCSMRDCEGVLVPTEPPRREFQMSVPRRARHNKREAPTTTGVPCGCHSENY
jgi:hypothetical protein